MRPPPVWFGRIALTLFSSYAAVTALAGFRAREHLRSGVALLASEPQLAARELLTAARLRAPLNPYAREAVLRLQRLASSARAAGDHRLGVWIEESLRAVPHATSSIFNPPIRARDVLGLLAGLCLCAWAACGAALVTSRGGSRHLWIFLGASYVGWLLCLATA